jgi:Animal haem peroxidase
MAHGSGPAFDVAASRLESYQGAYGRLRPKLEGWLPSVPENELDSFFLEFANRVMIEEPGQLPRALAARDAQQRRKLDSRVPAGYTYFGQFIDHDITYDPASLTLRSDPRGSRNFRTPRLDLDSVYGRGWEDQPYLYDQREEEQGKMLIGEVTGQDFKLRDLPRNAQGRALIGDMRNDENAMVSQLHLAFLLAHNALCTRARARGNREPFAAFAAARQTLRWLYQYVVWNDFIPRVTSKEVHQRALRRVERGNGRLEWVLGLDHVYNWERQPFMPVEFSVAAYRFGHSMVRNEYETNRRIRGEGEPAPLFDGSGAEHSDDLRGFRPLIPNNVIQWDWFLKMTSSSPGFPQMARKIDTKLANSLAYLHAQESPMNVLAFRNLKRGCAYGLPAGSVLAGALDIEPIHREDDDDLDALWFYILREAESQTDNKLGPLGSTIVCATFASLLKSDPSSYFWAKPSWTPNDDLLLFRGVDNIDGGEQESRLDRPWTLASIIRIAGLPISAQDVDDQVRGGKLPDPLYGMPPQDRR